MNYRLLRKETEAFTHLLGTFLLFCGNNTKRKLRLLGAVTAQAQQWCFIFKDLPFI